MATDKGILNPKEGTREQLADLESEFKHFNLDYMQRPPRIRPNYGKKKVQLLPKSNVSRVLLYDNVTQQQMLDVKLKNIRVEQDRTERLMDMHKKSFIFHRLKKQKNMMVGPTKDNDQLPEISSRPQHKFLRNRDSGVTSSPELNESRKVGFTETVDGITRIFNTFQVNNDNMAVKQYKCIRDPRFQSLEKGLVHLDNPGDGYLELSPSFERDYSSISRSITRISLIPQLTANGIAED